MIRISLCAVVGFSVVATPSVADKAFNRIAGFATPLNMAEGEDRSRETSAEIIAATEDGMTVIYTDSPLKAAGLIDISDPRHPIPLGNIALEGEPTSVAVRGEIAFIGVNTSPSFTEPSGFLMAFDIGTRQELGRCDLGGQPDSVAVAPDGGFVAVAIENERDEDFGDGRTGQMPAGWVSLVALDGNGLDCPGLIRADVTGLAEVSPEDPEPEYVSINALGQTVVTLQENNHIVILDRDGTVLTHFSAGAVDLEEIDISEEDGALDFTGTLKGQLREPDSVAWIDTRHFAIANEGDMDGGSRGWTIFNTEGEVVYESGASFEHALIRVGHYPESRSENKGVEPEAIAVARFGETPYVLVGSERGSAIGVYDISDLQHPVLTQILPSGIAPESYVALPERNLLVSANEADLGAEGGARAHVMVYEFTEAAPAYPMLTSEGTEDLIGWGAISGLVAGEGTEVFAVSDGYYNLQPRIYTIDASTTPARITRAVLVTRDGSAAEGLDLEGIARDETYGFWLVSDGDGAGGIVHVNADGEIDSELDLPPLLKDVQKVSGFQGVTVAGDRLLVASQRGWSDDPEGHVKLIAYDLANGDWGAVLYPTDTPKDGWIGISELSVHGDDLYVMETDNRIGEDAATKRIYRVSLGDLQPAPLDEDLPVVDKELVHDLMPDLLQLSGYVPDKVEGMAVTGDGSVWVVTDNGGVDDSSGETLFFRVEP